MSTIVVIDDRPTNREVLTHLAEELEDTSLVKSFADAGEALEWTRDNVPDLVVTDFKMPGMDGAAFTRRFRSRPLCRDVPVIVVTIYEDREFRYGALEAGATDFLLSPIDHHEFKVRARNLLTLRKQQKMLATRAALLEQRLRTTDQEHAEELRRSRAQLLEVIDAVPALISATDAGGRYVFANSYAAAFFGLNPDEIVGKTPIDLQGEELGRATLAMERRIVETGEAPPPFEKTVSDRGGSGRILLTNKRPLHGTDGRVATIVTVALDITERKEAETALARQKDLLRAVIDNDPNFIFTTDREGRVTLANKALAEACGVSPAELLGRSLAALPGMRGEEMRRLAEDDGRVRADGASPLTVERPFTDADGRRRWMMFSKIRTGAADGDETVLTVAADITERRRAEETLRQAKDEAEAANNSKTQFLANMSHELRTPLNAVIGFSEIIKEEALGPVGSPKYREYASDIHQSASHLLNIISDILDVSRLEAGSLELHEQAVDVAAVVAQAVKMVGRGAEEAGIGVDIDGARGLPALLCDERQLRQILVNLLSNAVKFSRPGGRVRVEGGQSPDGGIELRVIDHGIGIADADRPRVMERFSQIANALTREHPGTGLGLPIAHGLARLHGGRLDLDSAPGRGTTVTVRFPPQRTASADSRASGA